MKTDDLVAMLANGTEAADLRVVEKRVALALALGLAGAAVLMLTLLGVRRDLGEALGAGTFWLKLAFPATVLAGTLSATGTSAACVAAGVCAAAGAAAAITSSTVKAFMAVLPRCPPGLSGTRRSSRHRSR